MEFIDELANAQPIENVIPDGCLSFEEEAQYVVDMLITEYNKYCVDLGRTEITFYESTGSTIVYEGEEAEKADSKVKKYMVKAFGAIKAFTTKVDNWVDGSVAAGKKLSKLTPEMIKSIPEDKDLGETHTFFDPTKVKFANNALKYAGKVDSTFKKLAGKDKETVKKAYDDFEKGLYKAITGIDADSPKAIKTALKNTLTGQTIKVDKKYVVKNLSKLERVVKGDLLPSAVRDMYNEQKKLSVEVYKVINEYQYKPEYADLVPMWVGLITDIYSVSLSCYALAFDVYKRMHREYMTIISKTLKATNSKTITTESFYGAQEIPDKAPEIPNRAPEITD